MKAWQCDETRPIPGLMLCEVAHPVPQPGELLIRVHAVGVTPTELIWYPTTHSTAGSNRPQAIPGHEFSGIVAAGGDGGIFTVGQEVFGMNDWFVDGATAEFCCTVPSAVAPKPVGLTHAEAASIPISALTAWQGLFERGHLQPGERVLIHGGSGAVGVMAIQLARWHGARVTTTASGRNREFLLQLGAEQVIDYHTEQFEDSCHGIDVVFDTVGGTTRQRSWDILGPTGRLVTIAADAEYTQDERTKRAYFIVEPNQQQLIHIAGLLDSHQLQPVINTVLQFDQAGRAYTDESITRGGRGKIVVAVISGS